MANIQIGHARFHHDHIRPFRQIPRDHAQGFVAIGRIYLIGILIASQRSRGPNRIAERSIKSGCEFGGIAQNIDVVKSIPFQHGPQSANAPIHHIRGPQNIRTGLRLCLAHLYQRVNGFVVHNLTVAHDAIVTVYVIGIQGNICHDHDVRNGIFDGTNGAVGQIVWIPGLFAIFCFQGGISVGKNADCRNCEPMGGLGQSGQAINRIAIDTWHGAHSFAAVVSVHNKDRPNQIRGAELCFAHHCPKRRLGPQTPRAQGRKGGLDLKTRHDWNLIYLDSWVFF